MKALITAFRTLTIIPLPGRDADRFSDSLIHFPLVGAFIGIIAASAAWAAGTWAGWTEAGAVLALGVSVLLTGGLHMDGLADVSDSMGAHDRQKKLEIMKDPRIGSFGVIALVIFLLIKYVAFHRSCLRHEFDWMLVLPFVISRLSQAAVIVCLPYARAEGGTAKRFVEGAAPAHLAIGALFAAVICFACGQLGGLALLLVMAVPAVLLMMWMKKVYGGVTGDLVGMTSEVIETISLVAIGFVV